MYMFGDRWYEPYLGLERFAGFLDAAGGDRSRAVALVKWDRDMRGELMKWLGEWEIAMRNAYDAVISAWWQGTGHWLLDPASPVRRPLIRDGHDVNARNRAIIGKALRQAGKGASPYKIVANLNLGFWSFMTSRTREKTLWVPVLHRAYPPGTDRVTVDRRIKGLHQLRNCIAHHEPIYRKPIKRHAIDVTHCCELIRPELGDDMQARDTVKVLWNQRPIP